MGLGASIFDELCKRRDFRAEKEAPSSCFFQRVSTSFPAKPPKRCAMAVERSSDQALCPNPPVKPYQASPGALEAPSFFYVFLAKERLSRLCKPLAFPRREWYTFPR
jgi:hypothetical protein